MSDLRRTDTPEAREIWRKVDLAASRVRWGEIGGDLIRKSAEAYLVLRASDVSAQSVAISVPLGVARHCAIMIGKEAPDD